jgi:hypothetical protein
VIGLIVTPIDRRQAAVLRGSSAGSNPSMVVVPSAMAPKSSERWEMDLSPGTVTWPERLPPAGSTRVFEGLPDALKT